MNFMRPFLRSVLLCVVLASVASTAFAQTTASSFVIHDVRVFDGVRVLEHQDVTVTDGKIASIGKAKKTAPAGAIDGAGKTLLPGLIDAHTHIMGMAESLQQALIFGVTTELDMFNMPESNKDLRDRMAAGKLADAADFRSAGILATVPGGHGTEYGIAIPTLTTPAEAQKWVDDRVAEGSDYIKIVIDDGSTYGIQFATLDKETVKAIVDAAHKDKKLAVVHVGTYQDALTAINAGADGLAHLWVGDQPGADFGKVAAKHHIFVVPTLSVLSSITHEGTDGSLADDAHFSPYFTPATAKALKSNFGFMKTKPDYSAAVNAIAQLRAAKVPILAGTDAGNPGTAHGASMHGEMSLLVKAGLTPLEALTAATLTPARAFKLDDRGRIAAGTRADLLLVNGDPTTDIAATRDIVSVWKAGVAVDRAAFAAAIMAASAKAAAAPGVTGMVSDFESGKPDAAFGAGWSTSTDAMVGGNSTAVMNVVDGGANGSKSALQVTGEIKTGFAYPWAGAMVCPGTPMFTPVNASEAKGIDFWTKGDGATYRVMIFTEESGRIPLTQTFVAGPEWKEVLLPFSVFDKATGKGLQAIIFSGTAPGTFSFVIDNVQLAKP
jgi:imidazolonepropionase-like amidohydrolase